MNILYLCEEYPPGRNGGIGTMVQVLGRALVRQGHNVFVVGLYPHGYAQQNYEEDEGVKIWRLRYKTDIGLIKNTYSLPDNLWRRFLKYTSILHWDTKFSSSTLFSFIKNLIAQFDIDIIEMPDWNTFLHNSFSTIPVPVFSIPLVVKLHGSYCYFQNETGELLNKRIFAAEEKILHRADAVTAVSLYTADQTKKLFHLKTAIEVLYNSIQPSSQTPLYQSDNRIIFTGSLVKRKGVYSLLKAWNIVHSKMPSLTLHLYGKGPVNELKKIIESDALTSVQFHGHVTHEVLLAALAASSVAVFPSYSECFSMAPLEAMAAGCAVIYTLRSSGPELITDKVNGLLIDPDNADEIANAILLLIQNEVLRTTIAKAGRKLITEKFNIDNAAREQVVFYNKVVSKFATK